MKVNKEISQLVNAGHSMLESKRIITSLRREIEAGTIVSVCVLACALGLVIAVIINV